ncbi:hypothetical protein BK144_21545 [Paenibacillus sp. FSL R7-0273]|nr:hypothetical protein BK144_21545 [Paenibacillus sp. FSL R7-0273]
MPITPNRTEKAKSSGIASGISVAGVADLLDLLGDWDASGMRSFGVLDGLGVMGALDMLGAVDMLGAPDAFGVADGLSAADC